MNEHLKGSYQALREYWYKIFNKILDTSILPSSWNKAIIKVLFKGNGQLDDPGAYRGIALLNTARKCLTGVLTKRITPHIDHLLPPEQYGFRAERSTHEPLELFIGDVKRLIGTRGKDPSKGTAMYTVFIDFKKAFDSVNRDILLERLVKFGIKGKIFFLIKNLLEANVLFIDDGVDKSEEIYQGKGVPQGDRFSPLLFLIYIAALRDKMLEDNEELEIKLFADDIVIYSTSKKAVQTGLNRLSEWNYINEIEVNLNKTKFMKFRRGGPMKRDDILTYRGTPLETTNEYKYLGVTVSTTMSFSKHVEVKKESMSRVIGSLTYLQRVDMPTAKAIFNIKIWTSVTYGFRVIAPYLTGRQLIELDIIKSKFIKRLLGLPQKASSTLCYQLPRMPRLGEQIIKAFEIDPAPDEGDDRDNAEKSPKHALGQEHSC